jgi:hypothetical protein
LNAGQQAPGHERAARAGLARAQVDVPVEMLPRAPVGAVCNASMRSGRRLAGNGERRIQG